MKSLCNSSWNVIVSVIGYCLQENYQYDYPFDLLLMSPLGHPKRISSIVQVANELRIDYLMSYQWRCSVATHIRVSSRIYSVLLWLRDVYCA